jgi:phosphate acetyltransferase
VNLIDLAGGRITGPLRTIVFPEGDDPTIQEAALSLAATGLVRPVLVGAPTEFLDRLSPLVADAAGCVVTDTTCSPRLHDYAADYAARHDLSATAAELIARRPLFFGGLMVAQGDAHGMVAGIASPTEDVIVASQLALGLSDQTATPSSLYVLDIPGRTSVEGSLLALADPAMNPQPDASDLADIATSAAAAVEGMLGWEPRVALLSFSTHGSADHPTVDVVRTAGDLLRERRVPFAFDAELQLDAALDERIARRKLGDSSPVAGRANVLVFPNLDAANIGAKLLLHFARADAYGPFLLGFGAPVSDLSRGARVADVVGTALLVATLPRPEADPS